MTEPNQTEESLGEEREESIHEEHAIEVGLVDERLADTKSPGRLRRVFRRVAFSTRFQYCVCFLAMLYLLLSIGVFGIDITIKEKQRRALGQTILMLVIVEFGFNMVFLLEILVRIVGMGLIKYFSSIMNIVDIVVVLSCAAIEFFCLHTNDLRLSEFASLLFPFRLWYVIRIIDQKNKSRYLREVRKLNKKDTELKDKESEMFRAREENNQVENDLAYMLGLIRRINQAKREGDERNMRNSRSSWQMFVPQELQLKVKRTHRQMPAQAQAQARRKRWSTFDTLNPKPKLDPKSKRSSTTIF